MEDKSYNILKAIVIIMIIIFCFLCLWAADLDYMAIKETLKGALLSIPFLLSILYKPVLIILLIIIIILLIKKNKK